MNHPTRLSRLSGVLTVACAVAWIGAFTLTHIPIGQVFHQMDLQPSDILLHMVGYLGLSAIFLLTLMARQWERRRRLLTTVVVLPVYATFDELTQPFVGRSAALADWLADMGGVLLAILLIEGITACLVGKPPSPRQS